MSCRTATRAEPAAKRPRVVASPPPSPRGSQCKRCDGWGHREKTCTAAPSVRVQGWPAAQYARTTGTDLLRGLRAEKFSKNTSRENTQVDEKAVVHGFCLGAIKALGAGIKMSKGTREREHLTRLACAFINKARPDFRYTSIQVNKNYASALHVDSSNLGPSYIYGLGDYTSGDLFVHGTGKVPVKGRWYKFDGNVPHLTCPFDGERYTLIYFINQSYGLVPPSEVKKMKALGFNWPEKGLKKPDYGTKASRLDVARKVLPPELKKFARKKKFVSKYLQRKAIKLGVTVEKMLKMDRSKMTCKKCGRWHLTKACPAQCLASMKKKMKKQSAAKKGRPCKK